MKDEEKNKDKGQQVEGPKGIGSGNTPLVELSESEKEKPITEKIVQKVKPKPKSKSPLIKKIKHRNVPCILRFKKITAKQAQKVATLFKKLDYRDYTLKHSKGHDRWDVVVWFKSLDQRDEFEERINKLL